MTHQCASQSSVATELSTKSAIGKLSQETFVRWRHRDQTTDQHADINNSKKSTKIKKLNQIPHRVKDQRSTAQYGERSRRLATGRKKICDSINCYQTRQKKLKKNSPKNKESRNTRRKDFGGVLGLTDSLYELKNIVHTYSKRNHAKFDAR